MNALPEKAVLVGFQWKKHPEVDGLDSLKELESLLLTAGGVAEERFLVSLEKIVPATFIGSGKVEEIRDTASEREVGLVVFDCELSPTQLRNLEEAIGARVIDRTQLILDIFAQHAHSREGKIQVELAQLNYLLPRLVGAGKSLSRTGGGIGTRGPGETRLEVQRRRIRLKITGLKKELQRVEKQRSIRRQNRLRHNVPIVSIAGYTNSGKSTLLQALSKDTDIECEDALFVTLSPVSRKVHGPDGKEAVFNDTVGFIQNIPHTIIQAFHATLEEIRLSDLVVHLVDLSDPLYARRLSESLKVLEEIEAGDLPRLLVFNKIDQVDPETLQVAKEKYPDACWISARTGEGMKQLLAQLFSLLAGENFARETVPGH
ncbi:MAG TPA: GTPase HflX [Thermotogota bacterium]|nr:GTPase HflX [Thermotogota bacterium]HRW93035.1 GTPase HflX [Thermotogota bacterium]